MCEVGGTLHVFVCFGGFSIVELSNFYESAILGLP